MMKFSATAIATLLASTQVQAYSPGDFSAGNKIEEYVMMFLFCAFVSSFFSVLQFAGGYATGI